MYKLKGVVYLWKAFKTGAEWFAPDWTGKTSTALIQLSWYAICLFVVFQHVLKFFVMNALEFHLRKKVYTYQQSNLHGTPEGKQTMQVYGSTEKSGQNIVSLSNFIDNMFCVRNMESSVCAACQV